MKTFNEYIIEKECRPYWKEVSRSNGNSEAVLYGCGADGKEMMQAKIINVAKTIKLHSNPDMAAMPAYKYIKTVYGKCKMQGQADAKTRYCILLYNDRLSADALIPVSSLKGCEMEIKKGLKTAFGVEASVPKLPVAVFRELEM